MSDIQFKSTRTDGTDFYGGSVDYAAIARVRALYEDYFHDRSDLDAVESLEAIRRALEGDNDE